MNITPNKSIIRSMLALAAAAFLMPQAPAQQSAETASSKLQAIQKIVEDYRKSGERLSDPDVKKSIMTEIAKLVPLDAKGTLDARDSKQIHEAAAAIVAKKMPENEAAIAQKAEKEANTALAMASIKDEVSLQYKRGNFIYDVKGTYYGPTRNSIKVGDRTIPLIDITPEHRAKFDKAFNDVKRKEFVTSKIQDYENKKRILLAETITSMKEAQAKENEANGYVFAWKEWRTPRTIVDMLLSSLTGGESASVAATEAPAQKTEAAPAAPTVAAAPVAQKAEEPAAAPAAPATAATAPAAPATPAAPAAPAPAAAPATAAQTTEPAPPPLEISYEELKKHVDAKFAEIANTCSGIDADQGYKSALWGMTRQEIALMFSTETNKPVQTSRTTDVIKPKDGPIREIELFYVSNTLVRVSVWFAIVDQDGAIVLRDALMEKYGITDEDRKRRQAEEEEEKLDKAEKADGKQSKKKKSEEKKPEGNAQVPLELEYHWNGNVTSAVVSFKLNDARTEFTEIKLVKKNLALMKKLNEEERKAKEEAIKQMRKIDKKKLEF